MKTKQTVFVCALAFVALCVSMDLSWNLLAGFDFSNKNLSLERFIEEYPFLAPVDASLILAGNPKIVSVLKMKPGSETSFLMGAVQCFKHSNGANDI